MSFISYAQNLEDVILWKALKNIENGFYIDIGANHPKEDSVTKSLYDRNWNGINVEPEEEFYTLLARDRKRDLNLKLAVSSRKENIEFYILDTRGWSTSEKSVADKHKAMGHDYQTKTIETKSLDEICKEYSVSEVHFLKIDVEGGEKDVLKSFSFQVVRPWIVVVEATKPNTTIDVSNEWEYILFEHNYIFAYFDGINKYYVSKEHSELLKVLKIPPTVLDDFISIREVNYAQIASEAEAKASEAEAKASEAEVRTNNALHHYHVVINSNSWKITKPLRLIKPAIKKSFKCIDKIISNIFQYLISKKINAAIERPINQRKKLLIDCSFIYSTGLNTGIQRVVRNIVKNIGIYAEKNNLELVTVALVNGAIIKVDMNKNEKNEFVSTSRISNIIYQIKQKLELHISSYKDIEIVYKDDILLMLDSTWHLDIWPSIEYAKSRYVKIIGVTYDLIPITYPQFCDDNLVKLFTDWYNKSLLYFDGYIAISKTVMLDLQKYLKNKDVDISKYSFDYFNLGSDFKELKNETSNIRKELINLYQNNKSIYLIVSTIEPRKNHQYLFDTFKELWKKDIDVTLVIVGRIGWKTEKLLRDMKEHTEYKKRLWIFNDLDDKELNYCYKNSKSLLFPSFVEGYGLPIIESLQNGLPVLASDTPIHREVGRDMIEYFDINKIDNLVTKIKDIENKKINLKQVDSLNIHISTWKESAKELLIKVLDE